jgi:hypothetical protein
VEDRKKIKRNEERKKKRKNEQRKRRREREKILEVWTEVCKVSCCIHNEWHLFDFVFRHYCLGLHNIRKHGNSSQTLRLLRKNA